MAKKALVTGVLGQDGSYLSKLLLDKGYKVYGMVRRYSNPNYEYLDYIGVTNQIELIEGDMTDESSLMRIIKTTDVDEVYNLAAQSFVGSSWDQAKLTTEINALGTLNMLSAIKLFSPKSRFYQATIFGSGYCGNLYFNSGAEKPGEFRSSGYRPKIRAPKIQSGIN